MSDRHEHVCPECGAPRAQGGAPSCVCAQRAADALLETRSAEAAVAEDFNPLRIRPYVDLGADEGPLAADADAGAPRPLSEPGEQPGASVAPHQPESPSAPGAPRASEPSADPTAASTVSAPLVPAATPPDTADLRLFETQALAPEPVTASMLGAAPGPVPEPLPASLPQEPSEGGGRRRRFALVGAGAIAVVVAAAGFASGLFTYETPSRNSAHPDDIRASVPDATEPEPSSPSATKSPTRPPASAVPPAPPAPSSTSASPSARKPTTSASPSATAPTTRPPSTARPTDSGPASSQGTPEGDNPVLRPGDRGSEVTELQLRLSQLALFTGDANGTYNTRTENAVRTFQSGRGLREEPGVYGAETRERLESETAEPRGRNTVTPSNSRSQQVP
ncbi:peptidoglycan-binding protein [Streptomyces montanus]|uniref:Peptidoglycan-binding protein n=1 Tax=Streptomyces montanus TaxID=2580423 RepID=A0A5R9G182_9ACTN|nr:peptidoglycan-binding domain-containing protein [Streptomyces montanus]TLS47258.1 peptidoglycan-binding protein [Streptomyces montanus]